MDTSKEYIKMCEKAVEIQDIKKGTDKYWLVRGDYYTMPDKRIYIPSAPTDYFFSFHSGMIWLPRQDQLQEIAGGSCYWKVSSIYGFINRNPSDHNQYTYSMEQLWLAFVMKEKYNKTWDGKDWVCLK